MDFTRARGRPKAGAGVILTPRPLSGLPLHPILRHVCSWGPLQPFPPVSIPEERGEAVLEGARDPQTGPAAPGGRGEGLSPAAARRPPTSPEPGQPPPPARRGPVWAPDADPAAVVWVRGYRWGRVVPGGGEQEPGLGGRRWLLRGSLFRYPLCRTSHRITQARGTQSTAREQQPAGMATALSSQEK